jgi:hypothetical protein
MDQFYTHPSKYHNHTSLLLYIATIPQLHQHYTDSHGPIYTHPSRYHNHTSLLLYIATIPQLHQHHSYSQGPSYTHPSRYHTLHTHSHGPIYTHPSRYHNHTSLLLYIATIPQLHQHHSYSQGPSYTHPSRYHTLHTHSHGPILHTPIQVPQPHFIATVHSYYTTAASTPLILTRT